MAKKARTKKTKTEHIERLEPEFEKSETPSGLEQEIEEPTVEPADEPIGDSRIEAGGEEINEDLPTRPAPRRNLPKPHKDDDACHCYESSYPRGKLPPPPILQPRELEDAEKPKAKKGKDGFDRAMETLDEYYEDVPMGEPNRED